MQPFLNEKPVRPPSILVCENMAGFMAVRDSGLWSRFRGPRRMRGTVANGQLTAGQERTVLCSHAGRQASSESTC